MPTWNFPPSPPNSDLPLDPAGRIDADLPCLYCGYNLRGLSPDGACPECGTAVGRSALGGLLRYSDPAWVATLAGGMNWIVAGIAADVLIGWVSGSPPATTTLGLITQIISLIGYWKVTTPEPARQPEEPRGVGMTARALTRYACIADMALNVVAGGIILRMSFETFPFRLLQGAVGIAGTFALGHYAMQLAIRIPDLSLAHQTKLVMWPETLLLVAARPNPTHGSSFLARLDD